MQGKCGTKVEQKAGGSESFRVHNICHTLIYTAASCPTLHSIAVDRFPDFNMFCPVYRYPGRQKSLKTKKGVVREMSHCYGCADS